MKVAQYDTLIKETEEDGFILTDIAEDLLSSDRFRSLRFTLEKMEDAEALPWAVVELIKEIYPNARYGFDFSEMFKDKHGNPEYARGWVKLGNIDWTIAHKYIATALLLALLHVMRDEEKLRLHNEKHVRIEGESV